MVQLVKSQYEMSFFFFFDVWGCNCLAQYWQLETWDYYFQSQFALHLLLVI